jgi:hypothetical protein
MTSWDRVAAIKLKEWIRGELGVEGIIIMTIRIK